MIGVSGPSTSIRTLSTLRPESAARRCSTVQMLAPEASPSMVQSEVCATFVRFRLQEAFASAGQSGAEENDAGVDVGRMEGSLGAGAAGRTPDAPDRYAVAQRGLKPKPHLLNFPRLSPGPDSRRQQQ